MCIRDRNEAIKKIITGSDLSLIFNLLQKKPLNEYSEKEKNLFSEAFDNDYEKNDEYFENLITYSSKEYIKLIEKYVRSDEYEKAIEEINLVEEKAKYEILREKFVDPEVETSFVSKCINIVSNIFNIFLSYLSNLKSKRSNSNKEKESTSNNKLTETKQETTSLRMVEKLNNNTSSVNNAKAEAKIAKNIKQKEQDKIEISIIRSPMK